MTQARILYSSRGNRGVPGPRGSDLRIPAALTARVPGIGGSQAVLASDSRRITRLGESNRGKPAITGTQVRPTQRRCELIHAVKRQPGAVSGLRLPLSLHLHCVSRAEEYRHAEEVRAVVSTMGAGCSSFVMHKPWHRCRRDRGTSRQHAGD